MEREQIEKAGRDYALDQLGIVGLPGRAEAMKAFVSGADWRINSAWHDGNVSCEPRRTAVVLFKNGNANIYKDLRDLSYEGLWGEVDKFAYLGDLIPERKEETNGGR